MTEEVRDQGSEIEEEDAPEQIQLPPDMLLEEQSDVIVGLRRRVFNLRVANVQQQQMVERLEKKLEASEAHGAELLERALAAESALAVATKGSRVRGQSSEGAAEPTPITTERTKRTAGTKRTRNAKATPQPLTSDL